MSSRPRVLVVDDDKAVRTVLKVNLGKHGMDVTVVPDAEKALSALRTRPYDLVLTDVKMPGETGLELLARIRATWPEVQVVVMTGYGSVEDAVAAMKGGAADYLIKPIARDELLVVIERALENKALRAELVHLRQEVESRYGLEHIVGTSAAMLRLYDDLEAVADTSATVLLQGDTGTGKELFAHAIHYRSRRSQASFVRVNCSAIPESLLESELFGHERGAFSGAIRQHRGKFEQADGGTILLDEIGEIEPYMQVKLLRVLENGEFQRVGGSETLRVDVRVVASTNRDLHTEVEEGRFREDLFYRLNVVSLHLPSLKERREDIPLLVDHFLQRYAEANDRPLLRVSRSSMERLMDSPWPGNVRQLEHAVERAIILSREDEIIDIPVPEAPITRRQRTEEEVLPPVGVSLQDALAEHERQIIIAALKEAGGVQARAARRLGLSRSNLNYRLGRLGIQVRDIAYR